MLILLLLNIYSIILSILSNSILYKIQLIFEIYNAEKNRNIITEITLVNADVRLLKCKLDLISIDISINNYMGICKLVITDIIERKFSHFNFSFRKIFFMVKIWANYEAYLIGSNVSLLAAYALEILLIYYLNTQSVSHFKSEIEVFLFFIEFLSQLEYSDYIFTMFGKIPKQEYYDKAKKEDSFIQILLQQLSNECIIKYDDLVSIKNKFFVLKDLDKIQNFNLARRHIHLKYLNIIDPLFDGNNVGKSLNYNNFTRFKAVLKEFCYNNSKWLEYYRSIHKENNNISNSNNNDDDNNFIHSNVDNVVNNSNTLINNHVLVDLNNFSNSDKFKVIVNYMNEIFNIFSRTIILNIEDYCYFNYPRPSVVIYEKKKNFTNNNSILNSSYYSNSIHTNNNNNSTNNQNINDKEKEEYLAKIDPNLESKISIIQSILFKAFTYLVIYSNISNNSHNTMINETQYQEITDYFRRLMIKTNFNYLFSSYSWPNILEIIGDNDKKYLSDNLINEYNFLNSSYFFKYCENYVVMIKNERDVGAIISNFSLSSEINTIVKVVDELVVDL